jgi:hypothetical protein
MRVLSILEGAVTSNKYLTGVRVRSKSSEQQMAVQGPESIDMSIVETMRRAENGGNAENLQSSDVGIITAREGTEDFTDGGRKDGLLTAKITGAMDHRSLSTMSDSGSEID